MNSLFQAAFLKFAQSYFVYRNLHKGKGPENHVYSLRNKKGVVEKRLSDFILKDVKMHIGAKGRERVLREGRKNVHAGIRGTVVDKTPEKDFQRVHYDPKKAPYFTDDLGNRIDKARFAKFTRSGVFVAK